MKHLKAVFYIPQEPEVQCHALVDALTRRSSGSTSVAGVGSWVRGDGSICTEAVTVCTVFLPDTITLRAWLLEQAEQYLRDAKQECVLYEVDGSPTFVWARHAV